MQLRNSAIHFGAILLILIAASGAQADDSSGTSQSVQPSQTASRLQVTGSSRQFSIEADHADVQSALKAIFVQAGKQFDLSNNVAGQFTLKLDNQPLDTVLSSLCGQTFLKYHLDSANGIYHFEPDAEAERAAFVHIGSLNSMLRQQLRDLGLSLPDDAQLNSATNKLNAAAMTKQQNPAGNSANGNATRFGSAGGGLGASAGRELAGGNTPHKKADALDKTGVPAAPGGQNNSQNGVASKSAASPVGVGAPNGAYKDGILNTGAIPEYLVEQLLQAYSTAPNSQSGIAIDKGLENYLRQNNLVTINTKGLAVPVSDVLAELSRQSGIPIMLDPMVPRGARFRITLTLPACSLDEALRLILPPARLQARTINNHVYVTPMPEFQIFYGASPVPYVNYPYSSAGIRSLQNGQQGAGQNGGQNDNPK